MTRPTFFFSHARRDSEQPGLYLLRFFKDLEARIAAWTAEEPPYGTIDRRIEQGADWDDALSGALARDTAFVAVLTPLYGTRSNCGKELGTFLTRSKALAMDEAGQVTGIENVLPIQWMPRIAYTVNSTRDALIPFALRRVEDAPADAFDDPESSKAIERYRRHGMERCVSPGARYYKLLLDIFAKRIISLPELPPGGGVSFAAAVDAFREEWLAALRGAVPRPVTVLRGAVPEPVAAAAPIALRPLESLVVFHVTDRPWQVAAASATAGLAFDLIADPDAEPNDGTDPGLAQVLSDVRVAAYDERMTPFHAIAPLERLEAVLAGLSQRHVLVAVSVDLPVAPGSALEAVLLSLQWRGAVFRTARAGPPTSRSEHALPEDRAARRDLMRRVFLEIRGSALRAGDQRSVGAERLPLLQSVPAEAA